jgi:anti-anti-sigma factor
MVADLHTTQAAVAEQQRTLEARVGERTADLERTLAELRESVTARAQLDATVRGLSSPIIPVLDGILVMPLIGVIDSQRAAMLMETLLRGVEQYRATMVILDVTGVPIIDTQVARALLDAARAAKLLGTQTILVGLRPELAQTIIGLGLDLTALRTHGDLQSGVSYALRQRGGAAALPEPATPKPKPSSEPAP